MRLRYEGPREEVAVLVEGVRVLHQRGEVREYSEAQAAELLDDPRNEFVIVVEDGGSGSYTDTSAQARRRRGGRR